MLKLEEDFLSPGAVQGLVEADEKMEKCGYNRHGRKPNGQYIIVRFVRIMNFVFAHGEKYVSFPFELGLAI